MRSAITVALSFVVAFVVRAAGATVLAQTAPSKPKDVATAPPSKPSAPARTGPVVAVIPLDGRVGGLVNHEVKGTFDASLLEACLEEAQKQSASMVILDVNSGGGLVSEMEAICETIIKWQDTLRIVAFPLEAYSAAAVISLTCREMVVRPGSQIGASTIIKVGSKGVTPVEAKFASPHYAKQRQYMTKAGRPYSVLEAMNVMERELWWSPTKGFSTKPPSDAADQSSDWQHIDRKDSILTVTGEEAVTYGIAKMTASSALDAAKKLGLKDDVMGGVDGQIKVVDLRDKADVHLTKLGRKLEQFNGWFEDYFEALRDLVASMNEYATVANGDKKAATAAKAAVNRNRSRATTAAKQIRDADRSLMSRRIDVPDQIVKRLELDAELLGEVSKLVSSGSGAKFNQAAANINEVLAAWKKMLQR